MKWFKHISDSHNDPDLNIAWDKFGYFGIAGFWIILELYAKEYRLNGDGWVTLSRVDVCRKLRARWIRVELLLSYFATITRLEFNYNQTKVQLRIAKFVDLMSNSARRSTDTIGPIELDKELELDKDKEGEGESPTFLKLFNIWKAQNRGFLKGYPKFLPMGEAEIKGALNRGVDGSKILERIYETAGQNMPPWEVFRPKKTISEENEEAAGKTIEKLAELNHG